MEEIFVNGTLGDRSVLGQGVYKGLLIGRVGLEYFVGCTSGAYHVDGIKWRG
jgi:hypothetical protein